MRPTLFRPTEVNYRAQLDCVHHRMMLRGRQRARYGRWWWQQGRKVATHQQNGTIS